MTKKSIKVTKEKKIEPIRELTTKFGKLKIDVNFVAQLVEFYSRGLNDSHIISYYGLELQQYVRLRISRPDVASAIEKGRITTVKEVAGLLLQKAREGNVQAMIFYLKCHGGFRESGDKTTATADPKAEISFSLTTTDPVEASRIYQKIMTGG